MTLRHGAIKTAMTRSEVLLHFRDGWVSSDHERGRGERGGAKFEKLKSSKLFKQNCTRQNLKNEC